MCLSKTEWIHSAKVFSKVILAATSFDGKKIAWPIEVTAGELLFKSCKPHGIFEAKRMRLQFEFLHNPS